MTLLKIPALVMKSTDEVELFEHNEELVDVTEYSGGLILSDMQYIKLGYKDAIDRPLVRRGVADRLIKAAKLLPSGFSLKIYDGWRPYLVQKEIYDRYFERVAFENKGLSEKEIHTLTSKFVSMPKREGKLSYVHSSGGAVDLTVVDASGRELDMGSYFDDFSSRAATDALESLGDCAAKRNRRLLYTVMTEAGFTNYPYEWWHYDYGDLFYGAMKDTPAIYSSIYE